MSKTNGLRQRIAGKTKQALGEIVGDQELHEEGKAQESSGREEQEKAENVNPFKKLD